MKYPKAVIINNDSEEAVTILEERLVKPKCDKALTVRSDGNFKGHGYWLSSEYNWQIVKDSKGALVLLQLRKY